LKKLSNRDHRSGINPGRSWPGPT